MKVLRVAPWLAALPLWLVSCGPPATEALGPAEGTEQEAAAPKQTPAPGKAVAKGVKPEAPGAPVARKPAEPKAPSPRKQPAPAKPAEKKKQPRVAKAEPKTQPGKKGPQAKPTEKPKEQVPPKLFVFSPLQRRGFVPGEAAQLTVVVYAPEALPSARLVLEVRSGGDLAWTASDDLGSLAAGRHSFTYAISAEHFPPGDYTVAVRLGAVEAKRWKFQVGSGVVRSHFPVAAWLDEPPKNELEARRLGEALGFNMVFLSRRSPWRSAGVNVIDSEHLARMAYLASHPQAPPVERSFEPPPFVRVGDLLSGAGLRWVSACAVSGGSFPHFLPSGDYAEPRAVAAGLRRLAHRLSAESRFANCIGVHLSDEAGLAPWSGGGSSGPFGAPWRLEAFKAAAGVKKVEWEKGAKDWETWERFLRFRARLLHECLRRWVEAAAAAKPGAAVIAELGDPVGLARGIYPPQVRAAVPVVLARAGLDSPAGAMMAAFVADLARAGTRGGAVWFMPQLAHDAEADELRVALSLALARKIDGLVLPGHLDYRLARADDDPLTTDLVMGASGVNDWLTRFGDFLLALRKPREPVAVFYSLTEHIARCGEDPKGDPEGGSYPWTVAAAYVACAFAHFPAGLLTEEELLAGQTEGLKVIVVPAVSRMAPAVEEAMERFVAGGGVVLVDEGTSVAIEGARRLKFRFPDLHAYHAEIDRKGKSAEVDPTMEHRDAVAWQKLVYPILTKLMVALRESVERDYTATDPDVVVSHQDCGAGRYLFVVNNTQRTDFFRGLRQELATARTTIILREGDYALYDLRTRKRIFAARRGGHPRLERILPPGGLDILALLPEPIGEVTVERARYSRGYLELSATVRGKPRRIVEFLPARRGRAIEAAVPLRVTVRGPDGRKALEVYRAYRPGGYQERLHLGRFLSEGRWSVEVTELLSGLSASETFRVRPSAGGWVSRLGGSLLFDPERVARVLRGSGPLWVVVGTEEEARRLEGLAAALRSEERPVEVRVARDIPEPKRGKTGLSVAPDGAALPDIPVAAVVAGDVGTNSLLHTLHNAGVVPARLSPDYPGPGRAVLCVVPSGFAAGVDVVVAAGVGPRGAEAAFRLLERAAGSSLGPTRWVALSASGTRAQPAEPPRAVELLRPRWEKRWFDQAVAAATSPQSTDFTVGYFDGDVHAYDRIGKSLWTRRMPTRVRAIARSLDGAWVGVASYPGLLVLTSQGRPQWGATLDDASRRADFTALAIAPDGALSVAGTRRGVAYGYDVSGSKVFAAGEADADDAREGWQSRFGTITAIAISAKTGTVAIGSRLSLVALDPAGQELWASKTLKGVNALAWSFGEVQTLAVGTRDGTVACMGAGGTVLWQAKAQGQVADVAFLGTSQKVLAACFDGTLRCYDRNGKLLWQQHSPVGFRFVGSSYDGEIVGAADLAGRVTVSDNTGTLLAETERLGVPRAWAFAMSGEWILVGTSAGKVAFFNYRRPRVGQDEL